MIVAKVGGSLYDLPDLAARLRRFLEARGDPDWLLVPGGGAAANAVRAFDRTHRLGDERAHWLALRACSLNAHFLHLLLPRTRLVSDPRAHRGSGVLDPFAFAAADEGRPGCLPHRWDATSDSVAARAAIVVGARLVLLKSVTVPPGMSWEDAAAAGHVDPVFPRLVREAGLAVEVVNLRGD
ncbi:MAG: hypothetical protein U0797_16345 [Gemmataceae bacterium]